MSGEFRETRGSFFWEQLTEAGDWSEGRHEVTKALTKLYAALAPIEHVCARYEASDCGFGAPAAELLKAMGDVAKAVDAMTQLAGHYEDVAKMVLDQEDT